MTLPELMESLESRGVKLSLGPVVDAPRGMMTDQIKAALGTHKPALLAGLGKGARSEVLGAQRWGPSLKYPTPGIIIDKIDEDPRHA